MIKKLLLICIILFLTACSDKTTNISLQKISNKKTYTISSKEIIFKPTGSIKRKTIKYLDINKDKYFFNNYYKYFNNNDKNAPGLKWNVICGSKRFVNNNLHLSNNGNFVISTKTGNDSLFNGGLDNSKQYRHSIWYSSLKTNDCTNNYSFGNEGIYKSAISPNSKLLATINYNNHRKVSIYDINKSKLIKSFTIGNFHANNIKFTPNSNGIIIIFNNSYNPMKLYDIKTGKEYKIKIPDISNANKGYKGFIKYISNDSNIIVTKDTYDLVIIDLSKQSVKKFKRFFIEKIKDEFKTKNIVAIDISKDNSYMLLSTTKNELYLIDLSLYSSKLIQKNKLVTSIKINDTNNFFLTGEENFIIKKWQMKK